MQSEILSKHVVQHTKIVALPCYMWYLYFIKQTVTLYTMKTKLQFNDILTSILLAIVVVLIIVTIALSDKTQKKHTGLTWIELNGIETAIN